MSNNMHHRTSDDRHTNMMHQSLGNKEIQRKKTEKPVILITKLPIESCVTK
jgi:hypothetical protein